MPSHPTLQQGSNTTDTTGEPNLLKRLENTVVPEQDGSVGRPTNLLKRLEQSEQLQATLPDSLQAGFAADVTGQQSVGDNFSEAIKQEFIAGAMLVPNILGFIGKAVGGGISLITGSTSAGLPLAETPEEEAELRKQGFTQIETAEQLYYQREGAALLASGLVGGALVAGLRAIPKALVRNTIANVGAGATFAAVRTKGEDETLQEAIIVDALVFGGFALGGSLWRAARVGKKTAVADLLPEAKKHIPLEGKELGAVVAEETAVITANLNARGLARDRTKARFLQTLDNLGAGRVVWQETPQNIGAFRAWLGSPSKWASIHGVVGDGAGRVIQNGIERMRLSVRLQAEWRETLKLSEAAINETLPMLVGRRAKVKARRKEAVANLLDTVFNPDDIPLVTDPSIKKSFSILRNKFEADRETLRILQGAQPGWGINGYFPHVFIGDYKIFAGNKFVDASTSTTLTSKLKKLMDDSPGIELSVHPNRITLPDDLKGMGMSAQRIARMTKTISQATSLTPQQVRELVLKGVVTPAPGKKFFGNLLKREANMSGFESDPFKAIAMYAAGSSRKIAFHDYAQKAQLVLDAMPSTTASSKTAIDSYVKRVMGHPTPEEVYIENTMVALSRAVGQGIGRVNPAVGEVVQLGMEKFLQPRRIGAAITQFESLARLGFSLPAVAVNMSQTAVNTATKIGWPATLEAMGVLMNSRKGIMPSNTLIKNRQSLDILLRELDIEAIVPLSTGEQILAHSVRGGKNILDIALYAFQKAEDANRQIAGIAAYLKSMRSGATHDLSITRAKRFITETQFEYSLADAPRITAGPIGGTLFQFKKFYIKEMEFMAGLSPKEAVLFAMNLQLVGGLAAFFSLPIVHQINVLSGKLNEGVRISDIVKERFPKGSRGLPALAGIDVSRSVAIEGELRDAGDVFGPGPADVYALGQLSFAGLEKLSEHMPDWARNLIERGVTLTPDQVSLAVRQITPVYMRRIREAAEIWETQQVRRPGEFVFEPENPTREAAVSAVGFRSVERAQLSESVAVSLRQATAASARSQVVYQEWGRAFFENDLAKQNDIINRALDDGIHISSAGFVAQAQRQMLSQPTRTVKRSPRQLREEILQRLSPFFP